MRPAAPRRSSAALRPDEEARGWLYRLRMEAVRVRRPSAVPSTTGALAGRDRRSGDGGGRRRRVRRAPASASEVAAVDGLEAAFRLASAVREIDGVVVLAADDQDAAFLPLRVLQSYLARAVRLTDGRGRVSGS